MKPVQTFYSKGTVWEIEYLDGVAVAPGTFECTKEDLDLWRVEGTQQDGKYAISRPFPNKADTYFYRDMVIVSLGFHRLISTSPDMSDWKMVCSPPINPMLRLLR